MDGKYLKIKQSTIYALIALAVPTIIEQIMSTLLTYVDTAMVGRLGEKATASVSVTTTITWLAYCIPAALGIGTQALVARSLGEGNNKKIRITAGTAVRLALLFGVLIEIVGIVIAPFIPAWMGADAAIRSTATAYFTILCIPFFIRAYSSVAAAALRGVKDSKTPMIIGLFENVLNVVLNYLLIYTFGLGVIGAAIASAVSYGIGGLVFVVAVRKNEFLSSGTSAEGKGAEAIPDLSAGNVLNKADDTVDSKCAHGPKGEKETYVNGKAGHNFNLDAMREIINIGLPVFGANLAACSGYVIFAAQVSSLGTTIFAAHSIAVTAEQIFYIAGYGIKTATTTLIGISRGEGNKAKYLHICRVAILLTFGMQVFNGFMLYVFALPLMNLFTSSGEVALIGAAVLRIVAFSEPFYGLRIVTEGVFYGLGRSRYPFITELIGMWLIRIVPTVLYVAYGGSNLNVIWYFMIADNITKSLLLLVPTVFFGGRLFDGKQRVRSL